MIPKVIHYCWFGGKPKPENILKCISSWKKKCPDYKIIEWNEDNFCIEDTCDFVREAYKNQKWAFVSDYARLQIIYENGGVYLDTDVELLKSLDELLEVCPHGYMGFEQDTQISTGLGFAAEKRNEILWEMFKVYWNMKFTPDTLDRIACPIINTRVLEQFGLQPNGKRQVVGVITILPNDYLCPENMYTGEVNYTPNTVSIHHYSASWMSRKDRMRMGIIIGIKKILPGKMVAILRKIVRNAVKLIKGT